MKFNSAVVAAVGENHDKANTFTPRRLSNGDLNSDKSVKNAASILHGMTFTTDKDNEDIDNKSEEEWEILIASDESKKDGSEDKKKTLNVSMSPQVLLSTAKKYEDAITLMESAINDMKKSQKSKHMSRNCDFDTAFKAYFF